MNFLRKPLIISLFVLLTVPLFVAASTPEPPAMPRDYAVDLAAVMSDAVKTRLNGLLQELERKTTAQVLILTVRSLDGESIEEFAFNTKEKWRLGQKGKDNGVLIVVAVDDRKYRLEVGYGLEEVLPDSVVGSIGRRYLVPYFKQGDYDSGIYGAAIAVANTIASSQGVELSELPQVRPRERVSGEKPLGPFEKLAVSIFIFIGLILFITHPRQCFLILLAMNMGGGRRGWSGGGGRFGGFGGGGGSFGGGGGGSGGGGGASGGW
jgi:uncharacterized protein